MIRAVPNVLQRNVVGVYVRSHGANWRALCSGKPWFRDAKGINGISTEMKQGWRWVSAGLAGTNSLVHCFCRVCVRWVSCLCVLCRSLKGWIPEQDVRRGLRVVVITGIASVSISYAVYYKYVGPWVEAMGKCTGMSMTICSCCLFCVVVSLCHDVVYNAVCNLLPVQ